MGSQGTVISLSVMAHTPRPAHSGASGQYSPALSLSTMAWHWYVHFLSFAKVIVLHRLHAMILPNCLCRTSGWRPTMPGQSNLPLTFCAWLGPVLVPFPALLISSPLFVILSPIPYASAAASPMGLCTASTNEASRLERASRGKRGDAASEKLVGFGKAQRCVFVECVFEGFGTRCRSGLSSRKRVRKHTIGIPAACWR